MFAEIYLYRDRCGISPSAQDVLNSFCANYINNAPETAQFDSAIRAMRVCSNSADLITRSVDLVSQSYTVAVAKNPACSRFIQINSHHLQILDGLEVLVRNFTAQLEGDLPARMVQAIFYAIQFIDYTISYCQEHRELLHAVDLNIFK